MNHTQEAARLLADFRTRRKKGSLDPERAEQEARRAAGLIIDYFQGQGESLRDAVTLLCEITADENREVARAGVRILFPALIERLNDSFDPAACELYDRIFAQMIDFYRRLPPAKDLDEALRGFGLMNESDLFTRKSAITYKKGPQSSTSKGRKILLLSRVTIGADVAVTSVIIAKLRALLPGAEFVLLGSAKLRELFGGDRRVRVREVRYERGGDVLSRLRSWIGVVEAVKDEIKGLSADEFLLIDPDSRLTQLGLLPLVKDEHSYLFFESRSYQGTASRNPQSIGWLASCWANEVFGLSVETYPYVALPAEYWDFGRLVVEKLRRSGASRITVVSFGVGGNQNKRVSEEFEIETVNRLIKESALILDKGATGEEREQIDRVVAALRGAGHAVVEIAESDSARAISREKIEAGAITWDGGIGSFAGLIAASDRYVGYDSAGQHIAAALGVPTLTIFVNSSTPVFAERWRPYGPGVIEVIDSL
ncbi:MAG TPA: glycosyltransferase family 9 protein [Blastocatellia bacterium]|jgi:ADP-heptose:LPS heptosyltransferase|nr:glycosyltransferase family 9 protein [Blastocatellia bacterium]